MPISVTIDIAVELILENTKDLKFSKNELTKLFFSATSLFILMENSLIKLMEFLRPSLANLFMGYK